MVQRLTGMPGSQPPVLWGATFKVNSGGDNSLYDWSSSAPALVSVSGDGVVTFNAVFPTGTPTITISATPKGGGSHSRTVLESTSGLSIIMALR